MKNINILELDGLIIFNKLDRLNCRLSLAYRKTVSKIVIDRLNNINNKAQLSGCKYYAAYYNNIMILIILCEDLSSERYHKVTIVPNVTI